MAGEFREPLGDDGDDGDGEEADGEEPAPVLAEVEAALPGGLLLLHVEGLDVRLTLRFAELAEVGVQVLLVGWQEGIWMGHVCLSGLGDPFFGACTLRRVLRTHLYGAACWFERLIGVRSGASLAVV